MTPQEKAGQQHQRRAYRLSPLLWADTRTFVITGVRHRDPGGQTGSMCRRRTQEPLLHPPPSIRGPLFLSFTLHGFTIILFSPHNFASRIVQPEPCLSASLEECNGCFLRSPLGNPSLLPSQAQQVLSHRRDAVIFIFNDCPYVANVMLCPQKGYVEVLTIFECDLIWKKHLCRWNQVKMRSDWVRAGPKPNDWCPYRRAM